MSLILSALMSLGAAAQDAPTESLTPFLLDSAGGQRVRSHGPEGGAKGTALLFLSPTDRDSCEPLELFGELAGDYGPEGFRFLTLIPDRAVDAAAAKAWAESADLTLPVLLDPLQGVADEVGVSRLGTVVVADAEDRVVYRGAVDGAEAFLLDALEALMMGEEVANPLSEGPGRPLPSMAERGAEVPLTFHRDIAPIVDAHCVQCHREGQIGPMVLDDFEEVQGWAPMIEEVVGNGRMPPWNANPRHGEFRNARLLTATEKAALAHWARIGAPEGDPADAPAAPEFEDEVWRIGTPDVVYSLPEPQRVPATGVLPYRYVTLDPQIDEDRWVQAIEVRNTAPEVNHHVLVYLIPEGMSTRQFMGSLRDLGRGLIAGVAPGVPPDILPPGSARKIPAGSRFLFQLHYTPNGVPAEDVPQVAFRWADPAEVESEIISVGITNFRIDLEPRLDDQRFVARHRLRDDAVLLGLSPHMHSRGKSFRYELISGGEEEVLLDVPAYDFNWQHTYMLEQPRALGPGDMFLLTGVYDNSEDNPFNPDPDARVRWGDQTFEEMFLGWLYFQVPVRQGAE